MLCRGCVGVWLITTNDNLHALRFYRKRGLTLVTMYPGALEASRRVKPEIPRVGLDGIPLRDEIELELPVQAGDQGGAPVSDASTAVIELRRLIGEFVRERKWDGYHSPKNLAMSIAIEAAELMELFQWLTAEESRNIDGAILGRVREELADVLIYCLSLANQLDIDVAAAVEAKMARNQDRFPPGGAAVLG